MTIREITDKILEYHPKFDASYDGCDGFKSGNSDVKCTGIVSALVPTIEVIRKTAALGCNLYMYMNHPIIPHRIIRTGERDLRTRSMRRKKHF